MMPWSGKICQPVITLLAYFFNSNHCRHHPTRCAQSNRSLYRGAWMVTNRNRLKKSFLLWITCNNLARPSSNRSLSGNPKSSCRYPASGILGHGLIGISPWAFMWAKSAEGPSGSRGLYSIRQIILEFSLHVAAPSLRQRKNGERQRKF